MSITILLECAVVLGALAVGARVGGVGLGLWGGIGLIVLAGAFPSLRPTTASATGGAPEPLGISLGIAPHNLVAMFPAVNGYFLLPNYGTIIAAINFDRTGTTGIGKYVLNHSFMLPGLVATVTAVVVGLAIASIL